MFVLSSSCTKVDKPVDESFYLSLNLNQVLMMIGDEYVGSEYVRKLTYTVCPS